MSVRATHLFCAVTLLLPAMAGGLPSPVDGQAPQSIRDHGLPGLRPLPGVPPNRRVPEYQLNSVHDRVTLRTRVSVQSFQRSARVADGAFMSFSISATYPGYALAAFPDSVELEFIGASSLRRGWAFGRLTSLQAILDDSVHLVVPSVAYQRTPTHFGDSRRTDVLLFRIPTTFLAALAASGQVSLRIGRFTMKLDRRDLEPLRAFSRQVGAEPAMRKP